MFHLVCKVTSLHEVHFIQFVVTIVCNDHSLSWLRLSIQYFCQQENLKNKMIYFQQNVIN